MFLRQNKRLAFEVFDVRANIYPVNPKAFDLFVITGSKASVYDDEQWINDFVVYVKQLHGQNRKLFGICFGHQIIAKRRCKLGHNRRHCHDKERPRPFGNKFGFRGGIEIMNLDHKIQSQEG